MNEKVFPHSKWEKLVNKDREEILNRDKFFEIAELNKNEVWADFGCGPGYFTLPLATKVKKVYAIDISDEMLNVCRKRAEENSIYNIEYINSDGNLSAVKSNSIEKLLIVNVLHELNNRENLVREMNRVLKIKRKVFVIDWKYEELDLGPPLEHRITSQQVVHDFITNGFTFIQNWDIYNYEYLLGFEKIKEIN
ncbi:MAG: class I SAM-dependent methyltransferase [Bacteroidetes bacterium]|nr:class I SAM-dependent methyltransferase [Bacteroidota bacterium]